ncbi:hypothetical protein Adu01nite_34110 [Paractinoplanes durhamensis]|uniref:Ig-like domain-containing protein n=1 Tax=Paractinoplanes durhamensis TaxID=113563 RepID=A0ABQ3YWZ9_9ACTN|nr:Ig-like domain-containing protein [Actinoplanes durhamensis]GIE02061.1 hypothetical protein Adu01nite_34110 [Actinoplanes durhamensis]
MVAAFSTLLLTVTTQVPASAGEIIAAAVAPTVASISPFPGSYVRTGVAVTIEVRASVEVDHVVVYDGTTGAELAQLTGEPRKPWRYVWTSVAGSVSPNFQPVSTSGEAGALMKTSYRFDDEPPVVDYLSFEFPGGGFPVDGRVGPVGTLIYGVQESSWTVDDVWSIDGVIIPEMDEGKWSYPPRSEPYLLRIQVMDGAGNWGERTFSLTVDATGPSVTSVVPANGSRVRGSVVHSSLQADDESGVYLAELVGVYPDVEPPYAASLPAGKDGPRTLTWRVQDKVGNITLVERTVTVDNAGPTVTWAGPANGVLVRGTRITSGVKAADPSGVSKAQLSGTAADTAVPYSSTIAAGKDGTRTLTWTVWDGLGNTTVVRRTVTVDNTKATVAFAKAPKNKAKVKGTVKVTAAASDRNGVARVQLLVNGKVVATDTKAAYQFSVNPKKYGKTIKIQLRAYDRAGNVTTAATRTWYR